MTRSDALVAVMVVALAVGLAGQNKATRDAEAQMKKAALTVLRDGDVEGAIKIYRKIASARDVEPALRAQAQLEIGRLLDKVGSDGARREYELVIKNFKDQNSAVQEAHARLEGSPTAPGSLQLRQVFADRTRGAAEGSVSPDGRFICFTANNTHLAVRNLLAGTERILTNAPKADSSEGCSFSPSGDRIAYTTHDSQNDNYELLVVGVDAQAVPRALHKVPVGSLGIPAWTPDGRSIILQSVNDETGKDEALLVSVANGSTRAVGSRVSWRVFVSPDGRYLAFDRRNGSARNAPRDVFLIALDDGLETNVTAALPSDDFIMGWSPDSRHVLFASDRSGSMQLYAVEVTDGRPQGPPAFIRADIGDSVPMGTTTSGAVYFYTRVSPAPMYLQVVPFDATTGRYLGPPQVLGPTVNAPVRWSPDGQRLAFLKPDPRSKRSNLTIWSTDGTATSPSAEVWNTGTEWSPDSNTLAFMGPRMGQISTFDLRSQTLTLLGVVHQTLAQFIGLSGGPVWSVDQTKLYYVGFVGGRRMLNGGNALVEREIASAREREILTSDAHIRTIGLSPDGRLLGMVVGGPGGADATVRLQVVPVGGGPPRELIVRKELGGVSFSPDGRYIATGTRDTANNSSLLVVPIAGGEPRDVVRVPAPARVGHLQWTPDSSALVYRRASSADGEQAELRRVAIDGTNDRKVEGDVTVERTLRLGLSPDGRYLAFIRGDGSSPVSGIWALENFLPSSAKP